MISERTSRTGLWPSLLIPMVTATLWAGCVDLNKPVAVAQCAAAGTCTNGEVPNPDAPVDLKPTGPDLNPGDDLTKADLAPPDTRDASSPDVAGPDLLPPPDVAAPDAFVPPPDVRPDAGPDLGPDLKTDTVGPDLSRPDEPADLPVDLRPDSGPDLGPDLPVDLRPDGPALPPGLVAYYPCDNATGTTLPDSSGNGNNGTLSSAGTSFSTGKVGKALALAKANQGSVSLPPTIFANTTDITITAWVSVTTAQNWQRVFDVGVNAKLANNTSTNTKYMNLVPKNDGTNLAFAISQNGYGSEQKLTAAALATSTWKHVAVVLGSGSSTLYVDGESAATSTTVTLRAKDLGAIDYAYLGKSQFTSDPYFDGMLDEVRVYNRALSAAEVKTIFQYTGP